MARAKDKKGLTYQEEKFCQYVVDAYGTGTRGVLVKAYRMAYNCKSDAKAETHYNNAHKIFKRGEIRARIEQLQEEVEKERTITRERMITRNVEILEGDPLISQKEDIETGQYVWKRLNEIPLKWRKLVTPMIYRGRMIYVLDKKTAEQNIMKMCGFDKSNSTNVNVFSNLGNELTLLDEHDIFED